MSSSSAWIKLKTEMLNHQRHKKHLIKIKTVQRLIQAIYKFRGEYIWMLLMFRTNNQSENQSENQKPIKKKWGKEEKYYIHHTESKSILLVQKVLFISLNVYRLSVLCVIIGEEEKTLTGSCKYYLTSPNRNLKAFSI